MKKERIIYLLSIAILLLLLFFQRECSHGPEQPLQQTTVKSYFDTTHHFTIVPVTYPELEIVPVEWPAVTTDSFAIFMAYYKKYVFNRILRDDSLAFIRLIDTISQNRFTGSSLEYVNRKPTQVVFEKISVFPDRVNKLFVGPMFGSSLNGNIAMGASAALVTRRDNCYLLNADILNKKLEASVLWKISFRKKQGHDNIKY